MIKYLKTSKKWKVMAFRHGRNVTVGKFDTYEEARDLNDAEASDDRRKYSPEWYAAHSKKQLAELPSKYKSKRILNY